jgi:beta-lactamase superfamily II metal-dependent hydrolase
LVPSSQRSPAPDEVEVSLFGPGIGESVVLHIGDGQWIVVDSCIDRTTKRPVALDYLASLGVDVATAVKLVVITHWHDDHMRGVGDIVRAAENAHVCVSAALNKSEFFKFVGASDIGREPLGGDEFFRVFQVLKERKPPGVRRETVVPRWVLADMLLHRRDAVSGGCPAAEVHGLSPSSAALGLTFNEIARVLPTYAKSKLRAVALTPNRSAVVLWVSVGPVKVLLGADLEEGGGGALGWRAVTGSTTRPVGTASVFKVAHHGSLNGDHPTIWTKVLAPDPYAILTPFSAGNTPLPSASDIARIVARAPKTYCTARPGGWSPKRRSSAVERTVKETVRERRALRGPMGHIRLRCTVRGAAVVEPWHVDLFGDALSLPVAE